MTPNGFNTVGIGDGHVLGRGDRNNPESHGWVRGGQDLKASGEEGNLCLQMNVGTGMG